MKHLIPAVAIILSCVASESVQAQSGEQTVRVDGCQIILADERDLAAGQSAVISAVHVREGDRVHKGMLIAELDSRVPEATLAVARKQAENDVSVRFAIAAEKVADADYRSALEANRIERGTIPPIELRKLKLEKDRSILEIEVSRHELDVNKLRRDEAETLVNSYRIEAPMDGVVARVYKSAGEAVQVGEPLLHVQHTDMVHISADVDINLLAWLKPGREVDVIPVTPHPGSKKQDATVRGTVFYVSASVDPVSREAHLLVEVDNRDGLLLAGTEATLAWKPIERPAVSTTARRE